MSALAIGLNERYFRQDAPPQLQPAGGRTSWSQDIPRKSPQRQGALIDTAMIQVVFEQNREVVSNEIDDLKRMYLFADTAIEHFLQDHRAIRTVLRQAIDPLKHTFGPDKLFKLEVSTDDDGSSTLYAIAIWQADARGASGALHNFLESWWLHRMNAATSDLAFAYKLI